MRVKRTLEEMREAEARQFWSSTRLAVFAGLICLLVTSLSFGMYERPSGPSFVPADEIAGRLPLGVVMSLIFGFMVFRTEQKNERRKQKQFVVCPNCGAVKVADCQDECSCGGHFERIHEMKWSDTVSQAFRQ